MRLHLALTISGGMLALAGWSTAAVADEVFLKNGDRITGKIVSATGGKVVVAPDFAKETTITLSQDDIASFSSPGPITLKLQDGTLANQPVARGEPGAVEIAPGGNPQSVEVAEIKEINPKVPHPVWAGSASLNGLYARADTDSMTLGVSADGTRTTDKDRLAFSGAYNYGRQKVDGLSSTNANNWFIQAKYDYFFSPKIYGYGLTRFEADRVNFLTLRASPGLGAGYQWVGRDNFNFTTDTGLSWLYEDYRDKPGAETNLSLRLAYHLDRTWQQGRIKAFHDLSFFPSVEDGSKFLIQGGAGVRVSLVGNMYSEAKVNVTYDNKPAPRARDFTSQVQVGVGINY